MSSGLGQMLYINWIILSFAKVLKSLESFGHSEEI